MDAAQARLAELTKTQQDLLAKIQRLEEEEAAAEEEAEEEAAAEEEAEEEAAPAPATDEMDEEGIVRMLMMKQQELQRMREAIAQLKQLETGAEDLLRSSRATAAAPPAAAVPNGGSNDDLLQRLMAKRAQLEQMQAAVAQMDGANGYDDDEGSEEEEYEDEDDDDEPQTEEEWMEKLRRQQAELLRLRQAISQVREAGGDDDEDDEIEEFEDDEGEEEEEYEDEDDGADEVLQALLQKKAELQELLNTKSRIEQMLSQSDGAAPPKPPAAVHPAEAELRAVLEQRQKAQSAVDEQERKIAELSALQTRLRARLAEMEAEEGDDDDDDGDDYEEEAYPWRPAAELADEDDDDDDEDDESEEASEGEADAELLLMMLKKKTRECEDLAAAVEHARESGIDEDDERLVAAEATLAQRYREVKHLATIAYRQGLAAGPPPANESEEIDSEDDEYTEDDDDDYDEDELREARRVYEARERAANAASAAAPLQGAIAEVERLEDELNTCLHDLRQVEAAASESVASHPDFKQLKANIIARLQSLKAQLDEAREVHDEEVYRYDAATRGAVQPAGYSGGTELARVEREAIPHPELDLLPLLKSSVDKLWDRPYDCRVFLMQLLQGLSDLDDQSLCMMCSCFARYLENHSVPIAN